MHVHAVKGEGRHRAIRQAFGRREVLPVPADAADRVAGGAGAGRERGVERPLPHVAVADGWVIEEATRPLATLAEDLHGDDVVLGLEQPDGDAVRAEAQVVGAGGLEGARAPDLNAVLRRSGERRTRVRGGSLQGPRRCMCVRREVRFECACG